MKLIFKILLVVLITFTFIFEIQVSLASSSYVSYFTVHSYRKDAPWCDWGSCDYKIYYVVAPESGYIPPFGLSYDSNYTIGSSHTKIIDQDGGVIELVAPKNETCHMYGTYSSCEPYDGSVNETGAYLYDGDYGVPNFTDVKFNGKTVYNNECHTSGITSTKVCKNNNKNVSITTNPCILYSAQITPICNDSCCKTGDKVNMTGFVSSNCGFVDNFQIDADSGCDIQYENGNMQGMNSFVSVNSGDTQIKGVWTIPQIPEKCVGKTVYATTGGLRHGGVPNVGNWVSGTDNVSGSVTFCSSLTTTTTSSTTSTTTTSTSTTSTITSTTTIQITTTSTTSTTTIPTTSTISTTTTTVSTTTPPTTTTVPLIIEIESPEEGKTYGSRRVTLFIRANKIFDSVTFSLNDNRFMRACKNCDVHISTMYAREGTNKLVIKFDSQGNIVTKTINFIVDSKSPLIHSVYVNGETVKNGDYVPSLVNFSLSYTEENLNQISLIYGSKSNKYVLDNCQAGRRKICSAMLDLSNFDNQSIPFYFVVQDSLHNTSSELKTVIIDATPPEITVNSPTNQTYSGSQIRLDLAVNEKVRLMMSDNGGRFRSICIKCDSYNRTYSFSKGAHNITFTAVDVAGNDDYSSVVFTRK